MKLAIPTLATVVAIMAASPAAAAERTVTLAVDNMYCNSCPATVKKSLTRVTGVSDAKVSYETKLATVVFDDAKTNVEALISATTNAGYPSRLSP